MNRARRRTLMISGILWIAYLVILSAGLLWHFPWRGKEAQSVPETYDRETVRRAIRELKKSQENGTPDLAAEILAGRSEEEEVDEQIRWMRETRNTFRRMPCWRTPVKDELSGGPEITALPGGTAKLDLNFEFVAPVRAWDRFRIEILYGLAAGITVQILAFGVLWLVRWKRYRKSLNERVENEA